ncbi:hypothetical protein DAEQUDRAFT_334291 [Daedalea quercina L-15889]|uniref:RING-type domain-containing protein n=1 Tax=Daedalea quercina L-15889 TaxID=1314783 RepID=A0A165PN80_9APHY|nr:hypothetical protein DAEQUDRAFT_334291 [Daedalea quercina L-15889]
MPNCASCGRSFTQPAALQQHCRDKGHTYLAPASYRCDFCSILFASKSLLHEHYRESSKHPTCSRCGQAFEDLTTMSNHKASVHLLSSGTAGKSAAAALVQPTPSLKCDVCGKGFASASAVEQHKLSMHSFRCTPCQKTFTAAQGLQAHYRDAPYHPMCRSCNTGFADAAALQRHNTDVHPVHVQVLSPVSSDESFVEVRPKTPPQVVRAAIQCVLCRESFITMDDLKAHYRDSPNHPTCSSCNIGFPDAATSLRHKADVHPPPPVQTPSPSPNAESPVTVEVRSETPPQDVLETRSLPATPIMCPTPGSVSSARSTALSIKTQSDATSVSYSSRRASELSLPSAFLTGDGASVPWADYPLDTPQSLAHEPLHYPSDVGEMHEPPMSATTMPSAVLELTDASSSAEQSTPKSSPVDTTTPMETPQIRTIHVPFSRPQIERPVSALSYASEHASVSQALPQPSPASTSQDVSHVASEEVLTSRTVPHAVRDVRSRSSSVVSGVGRRRDVSAPVSLSSVAASEASGSQKSSVMSQGTTVAPPKVTRLAKPASSSTVSWHCRSCLKDPCDEPTATMCGHIFCHQCIVKELATSMACPVCKKMFLLRLFVESV